MKSPTEIVSKLYTAFGTDSGILFGIKERAIVETIVKFALDESLPTEPSFTKQNLLDTWDMAHLRGFQFEQYSRPGLNAESPEASDKEKYFKDKFNIDIK